MYITGFQINNYKSHYQSAALQLTPGFNLITGQNNAGKTALLEALSLRFGAAPHKSLKSLPTVDSQPDPKTWADVAFTVSREELLKILAVPSSAFYFPLPQTESHLARSIGYIAHDNASIEKLQRWLMRTDDFTFVYRTERVVDNRDSITFPATSQLEGYQAAEAPAASMILAAGFTVNPDMSVTSSGGGPASNATETPG